MPLTKRLFVYTYRCFDNKPREDSGANLCESKTGHIFRRKKKRKEQNHKRTREKKGVQKSTSNKRTPTYHTVGMPRPTKATLRALSPSLFICSKERKRKKKKKEEKNNRGGMLLATTLPAQITPLLQLIKHGDLVRPTQTEDRASKQVELDGKPYTVPTKDP